jgi:hypothetical protein
MCHRRFNNHPETAIKRKNRTYPWSQSLQKAQLLDIVQSKDELVRSISNKKLQVQQVLLQTEEYINSIQSYLPEKVIKSSKGINHFKIKELRTEIDHLKTERSKLISSLNSKGKTIS